MLRQLHRAVNILPPDAAAEDKEAVVQEVRVDLCLQLLELGPLGQVLLHIHLVDHLGQTILHGIEALIDVGELVRAVVVDVLGQLAALHPGEGVGEGRQGPVNNALHMDEEEHGQDEHAAQEQPGDDPGLADPGGYGVLGGVLHQDGAGIHGLHQRQEGAGAHAQPLGGRAAAVLPGLQGLKDRLAVRAGRAFQQRAAPGIIQEGTALIGACQHGQLTDDLIGGKGDHQQVVGIAGEGGAHLACTRDEEAPLPEMQAAVPIAQVRLQGFRVLGGHGADLGLGDPVAGFREIQHAALHQVGDARHRAQPLLHGQVGLPALILAQQAVLASKEGQLPVLEELDLQLGDVVDLAVQILLIIGHIAEHLMVDGRADGRGGAHMQRDGNRHDHNDDQHKKQCELAAHGKPGRGKGMLARHGHLRRKDCCHGRIMAMIIPQERKQEKGCARMTAAEGH